MATVVLYDEENDAHRMDNGSSPTKVDEPYRSPWRRDYARLIHCAAFRRLQGKTQLFPSTESDFFRNRLTHSLEVAQIAKSIALKINHEEAYFTTNPICPDVVEIAGLAHDLGHPPFGHNGEEALDRCMANDGGFEGNAQTLRILSKLEKKHTSLSGDGGPIPIDSKGVERRLGLNLTARTLAAILKYDSEIPHLDNEREKPEELAKGYYKVDANVVNFIKKQVLRGHAVESGKFKTIECSIMDVADDIAYSTYDLEDAFKAGFLNPLSMLSCSEALLEGVAVEVDKRIKKNYSGAEAASSFTANDVEGVLTYLFADIFESDAKVFEGNDANPPTQDLIRFKAFLAARDAARASASLEANGYFRTDLTSQLVGDFIQGIRVTLNPELPMLSEVKLDLTTFKKVEVLKNFTFLSQIMSPRLKLAEHRGQEIVTAIFKAIKDSKGKLLPDDFQDLYQKAQGHYKHRIICDFVAGMTDRYALAFYARLYGASPISIHSPL